MDRRGFLKTAGSAAVTLTWANSAYAAPLKRDVEKTNFLIILADDLGYGDLACYGHPYIQSPHIDQLARDGLRLTDYYAPAPLCSPARAGMLTGRYPNRTGIYSWIPQTYDVYLHKDEPSFARVLKSAGYETCMVGKWHLCGLFNDRRHPQPHDFGFDHWFATADNAEPSHHNPVNFVRNGEPLGEIAGYAADICADEAISWLENKHDPAKPFCIYYNLHEPHVEIATKPELKALYENSKGAYAADYYGNVTQLDHAVGRVLAALDKHNLTDNTLVMFLSDNGGWSGSFGDNGPLRERKGYLYEGGIRVPGIIRWPGHIKPHTVSDQAVSGVDILPTLCDILGAEVPNHKTVDGISWLPLFAGKKLKREKPLYFCWYGGFGKFPVAIRNGDWKLLWTDRGDNDKEQFELYNLAVDLGEKNNLINVDHARAEEMIAEFRKIHSEIEAERPRGGPGQGWAPVS